MSSQYRHRLGVHARMALSAAGQNYLRDWIAPILLSTVTILLVSLLLNEAQAYLTAFTPGMTHRTWLWPTYCRRFSSQCFSAATSQHRALECPNRWASRRLFYLPAGFQHSDRQTRTPGGAQLLPDAVGDGVQVYCGLDGREAG